MRQKNLQKYHWIHFVWTTHYWAEVLPLSVVYIPTGDPVEKTTFSLAISCQLEMASWLGMEILFPFFLPVLITSLAWRCAGPIHVATSLWVHSYCQLCQFYCVWKTVSLVSSALSGSCNLSASSFTYACQPWDEGLGEDIPLGTGCSKVSHSLYIVQLWLSIFVPIYYSKKSLWWWLNKTLVYGYSRMSWGFILLLFLQQNHIIWFTPRHICSLRFLASKLWAPSHAVGLRFN